LAGLLSGSGFSRGVLPNVFLEEPFFNKKQRSQSRFGGATTGGAHQEELCQTGPEASPKRL